MNKLLITASTLVLLSTLLVAGCGPAATEEPISQPEETKAPAVPPVEPTSEVPTEEVKEPVVLRVGGLLDADCWNPFACESPYVFGYLVLEGLADHGPSSQGCPALPRLADSWEVSEDGRTWTINLHEGITYSDGTPLTAGTVKESLEWRSSNELISSWFGTSYNLESVEIIDELTLQYTTTVPMINSPDYEWPMMYILPPHIWTELDESELFTFEFYPPIGTGPYVLTEHVPGSHMIFDAREDYYRGKPPIDRMVYQIYTNTDALVSALVAGEIDLTTFFLPPESVDVLSKDSNITIEESFPGDIYDLTFNMAEFGSRHPAVGDAAVRIAIDYAIDKQQIVDVALLGKGIQCPTNWACGPNFEGELNPDLVVTPFNLEKANQILDEAGYFDTDDDGVRETADGLPLEFRLYYATDFPPELTMSQMISDWLSEIGIKVDVEAVDYGTWLSVVTVERDFDMAIALRTADLDAASLDFWFSCWAAGMGAGTFNYSGYCSEEMDALVYEYWFSTDEFARWEPMFEAQRVLNQDRPIIILAGPYHIQAFRNDRFEFPFDTCYCNQGMYDPQGLLNAIVK